MRRFWREAREKKKTSCGNRRRHRCETDPPPQSPLSSLSFCSPFSPARDEGTPKARRTLLPVPKERWILARHGHAITSACASGLFGLCDSARVTAPLNHASSPRIALHHATPPHRDTTPRSTFHRSTASHFAHMVSSLRGRLQTKTTLQERSKRKNATGLACGPLKQKKADHNTNDHVGR